MILCSVAETEPHHFGGAGAGAVTTRGSASDSSGSKPRHKKIFINVKNCSFLVPLKSNENVFKIFD
jgi:hypothetical protein